jgi:hypothetical protein
MVRAALARGPRFAVLEDKRLEDICRRGRGEWTCRFLRYSPVEQGFVCSKRMVPGYSAAIGLFGPGEFAKEDNCNGVSMFKAS